MAVRRRPAAAVDDQGSATCCRRPRRTHIGSTDEYEELGCLGEGAFGFVVKARHRATKKTVAIKFTRSDTDEPLDVSNLLREGRFLEAYGGGDNPYVVGYHGMVRDPSTANLCLVMEYAGPSLQAFLRERRRGPLLPEPTVRAFMRQLLTGAQKMHERGVVHRDIKPANVLVADGAQGQLLKICDLGLAVSVAEPPPRTQAGTITYMAPETLLGKPGCDALVDAWSLGCVMAELVTGNVLFPGDYKNEIRQLWTIFNILGLPDGETWPEFASLPLAGQVPCVLLLGQRSSLRERFPEALLSEDGFAVLEGLLTCNPEKRLTAAAALELPWFAACRPAATAAKVDAPVGLTNKVLPKKKIVLRIPRAAWNKQALADGVTVPVN